VDETGRATYCPLSVEGLLRTLTLLVRDKLIRCVVSEVLGARGAVVVGVRALRRLVEGLGRLGVGYGREVREFLARRVREERARRLREEAEALAREIGRLRGNYAAEFVREVRDER